jgi:chromosome segregation and condensation protein ScpB
VVAYASRSRAPRSRPCAACRPARCCALLIEHDLIKIAGPLRRARPPAALRHDARFLDHFGLASLDKLPDLKDVLESS